jgi:hypothetical protein
MSRNSFAIPFLVLAVVACTAAAPAPAACPATVTDATGKHVLDNASLYDGPPDQMADLVPVPAGSVDRWDLDSVDPYLVCKFQGTAKVVTIHEVGAKLCEAGKTPFQAYCLK